MARENSAYIESLRHSYLSASPNTVLEHGF
jgi:hypothetical protein